MNHVIANLNYYLGTDSFRICSKNAVREGMSYCRCYFQRIADLAHQVIIQCLFSSPPCVSVKQLSERIVAI
jgi:hypothetical protein